MPNSRALVIKSIKNGESSLIISCYLEDIGLKSFIVKGVFGVKKSKFSKALFFPLNLININYVHNNKGLGYIKDAKSEIFYESLYTNIKKSSVIVFLSEVVNGVLKEDIGQNKSLFNFMANSLSWYDKIDTCNNFHIKFMIELSRFIGFYPNINKQEDNFFCLISGTTTSIESSEKSISGQDFRIFKQILGTKFEDLYMIELSNELRIKMLNYLIDYYSLHLQLFKTPKSIDVFAKIFK